MRRLIFIGLSVSWCCVALANPFIGSAVQPSSGGVINANFTNDVSNGGVLGTPGATTGLPVTKELQELKSGVTDLRGLIEIQGHQIEQLQVKQQILEAALAQKTNAPVSNSMKQKTVVPKQKMVTVTQSVTTVTASIAEKNMYQSAYQLIQDKNYSQAITEMQAYLKKYPSGQYAANAHYWLAQMYAIAGNGQKAQDEFTKVVSNFSTSTVAPDAMLKLGIIAYGDNQYTQAKSWFSKITKQYPSSGAARIAEQQLTQLQNAGY